MTLLPTPKASDGTNGGPNQRGSSGDLTLPSTVVRIPSAVLVQDWVEFEPAVRRWEAVLGQTAPLPTVPNPRAKLGRSLAPAFSEWMMGLPAGHVTGVHGLSRNQMLKLLGNGVVPQQAEYAIRGLWSRMYWGRVA